MPITGLQRVTVWSRALRSVLLPAAALAAVLASARAGEPTHPITIERPWSGATPPGAAVAIGCMVIRNAGPTPDRLIAATAEVAGRVTALSMTMQNDVMVMRSLPEGVAIPAHASVTLRPGSDHLMLERLERPLRQGDHFAGTLRSEKAGAIQITFSVESLGASGPAETEPGSPVTNTSQN